MKKLWIIGAGHGGWDGEKYHTPNAKQYHYPDGEAAYEGAFNRAVAAELIALLDQACIPYHYLTPGVEDIALSKRVSKVNALHAMRSNAVYLSLHANSATASIQGQGSNAYGDEIYTSKGETESDALAQIFAASYKEVLNRKLRVDTADGDLDKEANFYVLRKTSCPAILFENGFFDNRQEWDWMKSEGAKAYAKAIFKGIEIIEKSKL